ncbi:hypothetical protein CRG98_028800 [Punica granatum]|uniref:RING-type E3 ubiquitin transferase n=1 Tax=Punica granatum TaxID=22663 RepID=A0A2I0J3J4_PUNGR|nr:hypothetical protein CRG98_028800 [Punica granatum]
MWLPREQPEKRGTNGLVAVAIDKDRGSQNALKWAVDHLLGKGQTLLLLHVKLRDPSVSPAPHVRVLTYGSDEFLRMYMIKVVLPHFWHVVISGPDILTSGDSLAGKDIDPQTREIFLPFRCFCSRKDIQCKDIVLENTDVAKALIEYVSKTAIDHLVVGAPARSAFLRFKSTDISANLTKGAPDFCNVYVISKGKISSMRSASRPAPPISSMRDQILSQSVARASQIDPRIPQANSMRAVVKQAVEQPNIPNNQESDFFRSPFTRGRAANGRLYGEVSMPDSDISFVCSSGRPSIDQIFPSLYDGLDSGRSPRLSSLSDMDFDIASLPRRSADSYYMNDFSSSASGGQDSERLSVSSSSYMAEELRCWKMEEQRKLEEARLAEEAALAIAEKERAKSRAAIEAAEAARRIAELEAQKRMTAEMKALKEAKEKKKFLDKITRGGNMRCRKYKIDEIEAATEYFAQSHKIGEGGYGPVFRGYLDYTSVAIKVLRPDAAQGRSQFLQEVEVLSCIRHPNMVLLLGACSEYGCLVYEYMANGSLEDRLLCRGGTSPLSWQLRFKIAAEIGTGLLFLHQTKPEPLVHRDLKPGNILLDRNFVSKIADVGLARLVPPSVADTVTQYRMTSTAGTFCYIDPEYQQTGMLGVKSDIYSLGIIFLQLLTARPAMGLTHHVERAIEDGTFASMLDPTVPDWPVEEAELMSPPSGRSVESWTNPI